MFTQMGKVWRRMAQSIENKMTVCSIFGKNESSLKSREARSTREAGEIRKN
jgi:hypothetical protein